VILTGIATNICVLFTANDAYLRGYRIVVPEDCVAANTARLTSEALGYMSTVLKADVSSWRSLPWKKWLRSSATD
jgi:nicotinamidase-related amidase